MGAVGLSVTLVFASQYATVAAYQLTSCNEQGHSWKANRSTASQICRNLRSTNVHYRVHM